MSDSHATLGRRALARWDALAARVRGVVRIRVHEDGTALAHGRIEGPPAERLRRLVLELEPGGAGVVDIGRKGQGYSVSASAAVGGERLEQRLRNVLGAGRV